jgi:hypothetical protein
MKGWATEQNPLPRAGGRAVAGSNPVSPIHEIPANDGFRSRRQTFVKPRRTFTGRLTSVVRAGIAGSRWSAYGLCAATPRGRTGYGPLRVERVFSLVRERAAELCPPAHRDGPHGRGDSRCRATGLEITQPIVDRRLPKAPVPAEPNVRDPSGARLSPDPLGLHAESLGDLSSCQKPVHGRSSSRRARSPR